VSAGEVRRYGVLAADIELKSPIHSLLHFHVRDYEYSYVQVVLVQAPFFFNIFFYLYRDRLALAVATRVSMSKLQRSMLARGVHMPANAQQKQQKSICCAWSTFARRAQIVRSTEYLYMGREDKGAALPRICDEPLVSANSLLYSYLCLYVDVPLA
jgi:hypothetical protein